MTVLRNYDFISLAEKTVFEQFGDTVSAWQKGKGVNKFGRNDDVDTASEESVMLLQGSETEETYVFTNAITSVISDNAANTQVVTIEGHTVNTGTGDYTFVSQNATLNGTTAVTLTTSLARVSRLFVANGTFASPSTNLASGSRVFVYEGGTTTGGVPDTASETHLVVDSSDNQSQKAATTLSSADYGFLTNFSVGVSRDSGTPEVDFKLKVRESGGVFRVKAELQSANTTPNVVQEFRPYLIIPPNSDILLTATTTQNNTRVFGAFDIVLASIVT